MAPTNKLMVNVADWFDETARGEAAGRTALVYGEYEVSYGDMGAFAHGVARHLIARGFSPGDVIGVRMTDSLDSPLHLATLWGIARAGCVMFSVHVHLSAAEVMEIGRDVDLAGVIADQADDLLGSVPIILATELAGPPPTVVVDGAWPPTRPGSAVLLSQSSGTTGNSKLFSYTHEQFLAVIRQTIDLTGWSSDDRVMLNMPLSEIWGIETGLTSLFVGSTLVSERRLAVPVGVDAPFQVTALRHTRITVLFLTPDAVRTLLTDGVGSVVPEDEVALPDVRFCMVSSSPFDHDDFAEFARRFTPNVVDEYDTTEAPFISMITLPERQARPGSVGRPIDGTTVEVVDDDDQPVAAGEVGLIRVKSRVMATGYLNSTEANRRNFRDGWFYPMDLAHVDADGYIYLHGRSADNFDNAVPRRRNDLVAAVFDDEPVVWAPGEPEPVYLEPLRAGLFGSIDGKVTAGELVAQLREAHGLGDMPARDLLRRALSLFDEGGLLAGPVPGLGRPDSDGPPRSTAAGASSTHDADEPMVLMEGCIVAGPAGRVLVVGGDLADQVAADPRFAGIVDHVDDAAGAIVVEIDPESGEPAAVCLHDDPRLAPSRARTVARVAASIRRPAAIDRRLRLAENLTTGECFRVARDDLDVLAVAVGVSDPDGPGASSAVVARTQEPTNLADWFARHTRPDSPDGAGGDAVAIAFGAGVTTYASLQARAEAMAAALIERGLEPGDVVAIWLTASANTPFNVALMWAIIRAGGVIYSVHPHVTAIELREIERDLRFSYVVADDPDVAIGAAEVLQAEQIAGAPPATADVVWPSVAKSAPLLLNHSSGTTGNSKLFVVTHHQALTVCRQVHDVIGWHSDDRVLLNMPMNEGWGREICLNSLFVGSALIIAPRMPTAELVIAMRRTKISLSFLAAHAIRELLDTDLTGRVPADELVLPDIRHLMSSSAPLSQEDMVTFAERFTPNIVDEYDTTEAPFISIITPSERVAHPGSVGRPISGTVVEIVDDDDRPVPVGQIGLIRVKTPGMTTGYLNSPEAAQRNFRDGWFYPMDLAHVDADGYIYLHGRNLRQFDDAVPRLRNDLLVSRYDDELVVWAPGASRPAYLEPLRAAIFQLIDGTVSFGTLNADLRDAFGLGEVAARDLLRRAAAVYQGADLLAAAVPDLPLAAPGALRQAPGEGSVVASAETTGERLSGCVLHGPEGDVLVVGADLARVVAGDPRLAASVSSSGHGDCDIEADGAGIAAVCLGYDAQLEPSRARVVADIASAVVVPAAPADRLRLAESLAMLDVITVVDGDLDSLAAVVDPGVVDDANGDQASV